MSSSRTSCGLLYWPSFLEILLFPLAYLIQLVYFFPNPRYLFVICYYLLKIKYSTCKHQISWNLSFLDKQEFIDLIFPLPSQGLITELRSLWTGNPEIKYYTVVCGIRKLTLMSELSSPLLTSWLMLRTLSDLSYLTPRPRPPLICKVGSTSSLIGLLWELNEVLGKMLEA